MNHKVHSYHCDDRPELQGEGRTRPEDVPKDTTWLNWCKGKFFVAKVPESVRVLILQQTACEILPPLHESLVSLNIFYSDLERITQLPSSLRSFECVGTDIRELPKKWPDGLRHLHLKDITQVKKLAPLPAGLISLELWNVQGMDVGDLPEGLTVLMRKELKDVKMGKIPQKLNDLKDS